MAGQSPAISPSHHALTRGTLGTELRAPPDPPPLERGLTFGFGACGAGWEGLLAGDDPDVPLAGGASGGGAGGAGRRTSAGRISVSPLSAFRAAGSRSSDPDVSPVPGSREELTKEAFLSQIAERLAPFTGASDTVGVCFSHSAEILPNRDGRLRSFSKEIRVTGASGMEICRELKKTLDAMGVESMRKFVLLNDTAAVLLSGGSRTNLPRLGQIGFVLGTGMNISYVERTSAIGRARGLFSGATMVVNTEAGGFDKLPFGPLDTAFFETTADPREHRLEKITAGRYLGELILLTLKRAAKDGLLSEGAAESIWSVTTLPTPETSDFLSGSGRGGTLAGLCRTDGDRTVVSAVIDRVYDRAAKLSAAAIAAVLDKTDAGIASGRPARVTAEGSTFYKLHSFREKFDQYVEEEIVRKDGRRLEIVSADNAAILGTALAAMLQK